MNKSKKNSSYIKAIKYFDEGYIDKALLKCEEGISQNLKNAAILNLKGLLLYLKGDLRGAIAAWKINSDYNEDITAKNYILDSKKDNERLEYYKKAEAYYRSIDIDNAIAILKKCSESDFNKINVNLLLAKCYFKKADYTTSSVYLTKVIEIDKENKNAIDLEKKLKTYGNINLEISINRNRGRYLIPILALILIIGIAVVIFINGEKKDNHKNQGNQIVSGEKTEEKIEENVIEDEEVGETKEEALVDIEKIEQLIENRSFNELKPLVIDLNNKDLEGKEEALYVKALELLKSPEAIEYYYKEGTNYYVKLDYIKAFEEFSNIYTYGEENYLYQHGLYFMASCKENSNEKLEAIKYYEEYYNKFKDGVYIEQVLYSLTNLYKGEDLAISKKYAQELQSNYPNSIFNNENISNLLKQID